MILSIDCGTQSTRAIIFNSKGDIIEKHQVFYEPYFSEKPGWAEQNAEVYWNSVCKATKEIKRINPEVFSQIKGIGVTTLRGTMVNVDENGSVLRNSAIWLDQRLAKNVYRPNLLFKIIFKAIGLSKTLEKMESKGHCNWIRQNQPEIWKKTYKYTQVSGYLNHKLTGNFKDSTASQIGYIPFDYKKQRWSSGNNPIDMSSKLFPIEKEKLPELIMPGGVIGVISDKASSETGLKPGILVISCGSDKGCETLGMGVIDDNMCSLSFGTTATVQTTSSKYVEPISFLPAYPSVFPNKWNPEIEIFRGFWMISWFKNEFALKEVQEAKQRNIKTEEVLNELLHKSKAGAEGLIVLPYWTPGLGEKNAKGAMIGFSDIHKKEHIYRAVIEGLAFGLLDGMHKLEKKGGYKFTKITASGGGAQSDEICQITADIFNMPLLRGKTHETSGLGAAIITAVAVGEYKTIEEAVKNMVSYQDEFMPNNKNTELYKRLFNDVYKHIHNGLEPLNKKINQIIST